ncbi:MAG: hypothetical protein IIZ47_06170 [Erysipelotrichaceae bacterium]|nr:hypothetical protein [Erysipelotrichaceae bacterium]
MIRRTLILTRVFLKSLFTGAKGKKIGRYILYFFLFAYFIGLLGFGSYYMINLLKTVRQVKVFAGLVLSANVFLALFLSLISSISVLYFSNDNLSVLPLPVRPMEITAAKINTLLVYEYLEELLFGVIPLGVYGVMTHQPVTYYLVLIPVLILLPIVPLCLACFLIIALMSVSGKLRNKNVTQVITMLLAIGFSVGLSFFINTHNSDQAMMEMLIHANGLLEKFRSLLPTLRFAIDALLERNMLSLLLLLLVSVIFYVVTVLVSQKLYFKGMLGSLFSSAGISSKKINTNTAYQSKGLTVSYVLNEFRTYLRRPVFLVQLFLPCVILPVLMVGLMYMGMKNGFESSGEDFSILLTELQDPSFAGYFFAATLLLVFFSSMYCFLSVVAISKDGKDAAFMKTIPVAFERQVFCKALPDILMTLFSALLALIPGVILFKIPFYMCALCMLVLLPFSILHGALIVFDLRAPKLDWSNEMEIVKRNMRMFIPMGICMGNMAAVAFLLFYYGLSPLTGALILFAVYSLIAVLLWWHIRKRGADLASAIY